MAPSYKVEAPAVPAHTIYQPHLFKGKVLFCTGGGSGICYAMVRAVVGLGASAVIVGRRQNVLDEASASMHKDLGLDMASDPPKRRCQGISADVRQPKQLEEAAKKTFELLGRIDFVICGAAGNFLAPIEKLSVNAFKTVMEIDTMGTYNTIKATLPYVKQNTPKGGVYIHVSATLHYTATPLQAHVSAAKAGVDALSNVLAIEYGPEHYIRSVVIAPGPIAGTEGMKRLGAGLNEEIARRIPLGREGSTEDIANMTVFLLSPAASYVTGVAIPVDGGSRHFPFSVMPYPEIVTDFAELSKLAKL